MAKNIIEVPNFTKKYGDFKAVDDISFYVGEGSIFAFLGPNGAGEGKIGEKEWSISGSISTLP